MAGMMSQFVYQDGVAPSHHVRSRRDGGDQKAEQPVYPQLVINDGATIGIEDPLVFSWLFQTLRQLVDDLPTPMVSFKVWSR